ncbi:MAG: hypothetical protein ACKVH1_04635, partial [Alphaproteobacteria bacterium]
MSALVAALPRAIEQAELLEASLKYAKPDATLLGAAGCLIPILTALKWRGDPNQLVESLPHFVGELDIDDLRDVLARLGFKTQQVEGTASRIDARMLPCLYETDQGRVVAILSRDGDDLNIFDPARGGECQEPADQLHGSAYVIDDAADAPTDRSESDTPWFTLILRRFRRTIAIMFAATFVINILAIAVPLSIMVIYDQVIGRQNGGFLPYLAIGIVLAMTVEF